MSKAKCEKFLIENGWAKEEDEPLQDLDRVIKNSDYDNYNKDGYFSIDIDESEIVIIAEEGDIAHLPLNYYALIGYLMELRQLDCNYKSI